MLEKHEKATERSDVQINMAGNGSPRGMLGMSRLLDNKSENDSDPDMSPLQTPNNHTDVKPKQ